MGSLSLSATWYTSIRRKRCIWSIRNGRFKEFLEISWRYFKMILERERESSLEETTSKDINVWDLRHNRLRLTSPSSGRGNKLWTEKNNKALKPGTGSTSALMTLVTVVWYRLSIPVSPLFSSFLGGSIKISLLMGFFPLFFCKMHLMPRACNLVSTWTKHRCVIYPF